MPWLIYKHTNKINGKVYIGQTMRSIDRRWGKDGYNYDPTFKFGKAILKYGWSNFNHEIVESNISTQKEADEREKYWISFYDSYRHGYNMTQGGGGFDGAHKTKGVYQVSPDKEILNHFNSITEAAIFLQILPQNIGQCLFGKSLTAGGYYFFSDQIDVNNFELPTSKYNRDVICVETDKVYKSIKKASLATKICYSSIAGCCSRLCITAGGFHWAYLDEYDDDWEPLQEKENDFSYIKKAIICVETGEVWQSIIDCSIETKISAQNLSQWCCISHKPAKGKHYAYLSEFSEGWLPAETYDTKHRKECSSLKKEIYCLQTNKFYSSATECAERLNIPVRSVSRCAAKDGDLIQTHGYNFCYREDWYPGWEPRCKKEFGYVVTEEIKMKMRQSSYKAKRVLCVETNIIYQSTKEAERQTGASSNIISKICKHKKYENTAGGFHWKYVDE